MIVPGSSNKGDRWDVHLAEGNGVVTGGELKRTGQTLKRKVSLAKVGRYAIVLVISDQRGQPISVQSALVEVRPGIVVEWIGRIGGPVGAALLMILSYFGDQWRRFGKRARQERVLGARLAEDLEHLKRLMEAGNPELSFPEWIARPSAEQFSVLFRSRLGDCVSRLQDLIRQWNGKRFQSNAEAFHELEEIRRSIPREGSEGGGQDLTRRGTPDCT